MSEEVAKKRRQDQCINLTSEGGFGNACKTLVGPQPLIHTTEVRDRLAAKHPQANHPVDLSTFGNSSSDLLVPVSS